MTREVRDLARRFSEQAVLALAAILDDKTAPHMAVVKAAEALLDRGHGRPTHHIEARVDPLAALSDEELKAAIEFFREHCDRGAGGEDRREGEAEGGDVPVH